MREEDEAFAGGRSRHQFIPLDAEVKVHQDLAQAATEENLNLPHIGAFPGTTLAGGAGRRPPWRRRSPWWARKKTKTDMAAVAGTENRVHQWRRRMFAA